MNNKKINALISGVNSIMCIAENNPNGGIQYTCPFCLSSKEVKDDDFVAMCELPHDDDCSYKIANELNKERKCEKCIYYNSAKNCEICVEYSEYDEEKEL